MLKYLAVTAVAFVVLFAADTRPTFAPSKGTFLFSEAEAVVGRPATPHSAAGHRRRVTRRR
jgi:hypothetical protein